MQFSQMLNKATLEVIEASIALDPYCGMEFNKISDKDKDHDPSLPWRKDFENKK